MTREAFPISTLYKSELYNFYRQEICYGTFYKRLQETIQRHPDEFPMQPRKKYVIKKKGKVIRQASARASSFSRKLLTSRQVELFVQHHGRPRGWS